MYNESHKNLFSTFLLEINRNNDNNKIKMYYMFGQAQTALLIIIWSAIVQQTTKKFEKINMENSHNSSPIFKDLSPQIVEEEGRFD